MKKLQNYLNWIFNTWEYGHFQCRNIVTGRWLPKSNTQARRARRTGRIEFQRWVPVGSPFRAEFAVYAKPVIYPPHGRFIPHEKNS